MSESEQSDLNDCGPVDYGQHRYWDERYKNSQGKRFQWLQPFQNLREQIEQLVKHNHQSKILNIGCGNSAIQDQLYEVGYHCITNNDISSVVIDQMNEVRQQKGYQKMIYQVMDVREMKYQNDKFDLIIDKSTIDALMCSDSPFVSTAQMVEECYRVLKPDGYYFVISYAENRAEQLMRKHVNWSMKIQQKKRQNQDGEELTHYLYICKKIPLGTNMLNEMERKHFYHLLKKEQQEYYK